MSRYAVILSPVVVWAVAAAPVPSAKPVFGNGGVVTRAELERLRYQTARKDSEAVKANPGLLSVGVALHLPRMRFKEGEPVPAYFVVRNLASRRTGIDMRLDLFADPIELRNGWWIKLVRREDGKEIRFVSRRVWVCGSGPPVTVPEKGFYCVYGDLNRGASGALPPGEYECSWAYSGLWSQTVNFTVERGGRKVAHPSPARRPGIRFVELVPPEEPGRRHVAPMRAELHPKDTGEVAGALALGVAGHYYPNVRDLPARDELVAVSAEWRDDAEGESVRVKLRAAGKARVVEFSGCPHLYLQMEEEGKDRQWERPREERKEGMTGRDGAIRTPLTLDVPLPKDWRKTLGVSDRARVAVVVSANRLRMPDGRGVSKEASRLVAHGSPPVWSGLLRTAFVELPARK